MNWRTVAKHFSGRLMIDTLPNKPNEKHKYLNPPENDG